MDTKPGIGPLTPKQAGDFIFDVLSKSEYKCPACGRNEFALAYAESSDGFIQPYQLVAHIKPTYTFAAIPLVCDNCGHVTFFAHKTVGDKIHGRK